MPRLNQKKVITLRAKITQVRTLSIEVNPSVRLTAVQAEVDRWTSGLMAQYPDCTVEVTAEGLV